MSLRFKYARIRAPMQAIGRRCVTISHPCCQEYTEIICDRHKVKIPKFWFLTLTGMRPSCWDCITGQGSLFLNRVPVSIGSTFFPFPLGEFRWATTAANPVYSWDANGNLVFAAPEGSCNAGPLVAGPVPLAWIDGGCGLNGGFSLSLFLGCVSMQDCSSIGAPLLVSINHLVGSGPPPPGAVLSATGVPGINPNDDPPYHIAALDVPDAEAIDPIGIGLPGFPLCQCTDTFVPDPTQQAPPFGFTLRRCQGYSVELIS